VQLALQIVTDSDMTKISVTGHSKHKTKPCLEHRTQYA